MSNNPQNQAEKPEQLGDKKAYELLKVLDGMSISDMKVTLDRALYLAEALPIKVVPPNP